VTDYGKYFKFDFRQKNTSVILIAVVKTAVYLCQGWKYVSGGP
jgi:hypothetical protein